MPKVLRGQVATLQSQFNSFHILTESEIAAVPAFRKIHIQTEYAEILALFGHN